MEHINQDLTMNNYNNRYYVIFDCTELSTIDFTQVLETSADTVRKSIDETKTFVKYNFTSHYSGSDNPVLVETMPSSIQLLTTKLGPYTHEEMTTLLTGSDWASADPA